MHRILLLLSETCLPDFLINPIGKNFCSFSFFALIIFYQFKVFNLIDDIFVVSASSLNCCFYQFVILSYILYFFLTFCIFNIYRTFLKTTLRDGSFLIKDYYYLYAWISRLSFGITCLPRYVPLLHLTSLNPLFLTTIILHLLMLMI